MTLDSIAVEHKEIDTIIDEGKAFGLYDISKVKFIEPGEECARTEDLVFESESVDYFNDNTRTCDESVPWDNSKNNNLLLKRSDSEVTIIRVKRESLKLQKREHSKWEGIHDEAVPGDGSHLGESPSLVNLVTFVNSTTSPLKQDAGEYLVPISSWDPVSKSKAVENIPNLTPGDVAPELLNESEIASNITVSPEIEEIHRSMNIVQMSESRLHFPYMMKQKQSPRPGALFSNKTFAPIKTDEIVAAVATTKVELEMIKPPPSFERKSFRQLCIDFLRAVACVCCSINADSMPTKRSKMTETTDVAVQTMDHEMEVLL